MYICCFPLYGIFWPREINRVVYFLLISFPNVLALCIETFCLYWLCPFAVAQEFCLTCFTLSVAALNLPLFSFLFFLYPNLMFKEPMVWKVFGKTDRSIIFVSIITVKFSISKYDCQKHYSSNWLQLSERFHCGVVTCVIWFMTVFSQQSFLKHNGTQNHVSICTLFLVAVGENTPSPCDIPLQNKALTWNRI